MEYLILTAFVVVAILVPLGLFLYSSASGTTRASIATNQVNELGHGLLKDAKQMYYLGLYSKLKVKYEIPSNINRMLIAEIDIAGSGSQYYLAVLFDDGKNSKTYYFQSEVPIISLYELGSVDNNGNDAAGNLIIKECAESGISCTFYNFDKSIIGPGIRGFKVETVMDDGDAKVAITPLNA
ncbi:hypothetical protein KY320_00970 [Candidatus Woesearchaeota archaeon]|nr:hypothetical protein [Candidatus Woesearchaeota archaeon]